MGPGQKMSLIPGQGSSFITGPTGPTGPAGGGGGGSFLPLAGGTMTGAIAMSNNKVTGLAAPTAGTDAATKAYVDAAPPVGGPYLPLTGGTITGVLNANGGTTVINGINIGNNPTGPGLTVQTQTSLQGEVYMTGLAQGATDTLLFWDVNNEGGSLNTGPVSGLPFLPLAGGTMTGNLTMGSNDINFSGNGEIIGAINVATKQLSNPLGGSASIDVNSPLAVLAPNATTLYGGLAVGGTRITDVGTPSVGTDAATKAYVDAAAPVGGPYLALAGGTMTGAINMGSQNLESANRVDAEEVLAPTVLVDTLNVNSATVISVDADFDMKQNNLTGVGAVSEPDGNSIFMRDVNSRIKLQATSGVDVDGGLTITSGGFTNATGTVTLGGAIKAPNLTSAQQTNILYYNATSSQIFYGLPPTPPTILNQIPQLVDTPVAGNFNLSFTTIPAAGIGYSYVFSTSDVTTYNIGIPDSISSTSGLLIIANSWNNQAEQNFHVRNNAQNGCIDVVLKPGDCIIIEYTPFTGPGQVEYQPQIIGSYIAPAPPAATPTLAAVLGAGHTTGGVSINFETTSDIQNCGTADIATVQTEILNLLPGSLNNAIVVGNDLEMDNDQVITAADNLVLRAPATKQVRFKVNTDDVVIVAGEKVDVFQNTDFHNSDILGVNSIYQANIGSSNFKIYANGSEGGVALFNGETKYAAFGEVGGNALYAPLSMNNNAIIDCPTITAIETDVGTLQTDVAGLQTTKADKVNTLYVNSYYVNDGVNDFQAVVDTIGADAANVIYASAGSYGGSTLVLSQFTNGSIMGPGTGGNPTTICELAGGRGLTLQSGSSTVRISNLQVEGLTQFAAGGNNYFQSVQMLGGLTVAAGTTGSLFMYDCEFGGEITVPSTFAGVLGFVRCNFTGTTFSLNNASPAQVQFTQATGLVATYPLKALYGGTNQLASGAVFEGVNSIQPVGAASFTTTGCASLGASLGYNAGTNTISLLSQTGDPLSSQVLSGGGGGGSGFYEYQAIIATQGPPIGAGHIEWNNETQSLATVIYVSHLTSNGDDIDIFLEAISEGDTLVIQDRNNSANAQRWLVNGTPTNIPNDYHSFPVELVSGSYVFSGSQAIALIPIATAKGVLSVSAGTGTTVTGTASNPVVNADVVDIAAGTGIDVQNTSGTYTISLASSAIPTLGQVMTEGATASQNLNMSGFDITNASQITASTFNGALNGIAASANKVNTPKDADGILINAGGITDALPVGFQGTVLTAVSIDGTVQPSWANPVISYTTAGTGITVNEVAPFVYNVNNDGVLDLTAGSGITLGGTKANYTINATTPTLGQVMTEGALASTSLAMNGNDITGAVTITANTFVGALQGNADTATTATTADEALDVAIGSAGILYNVLTGPSTTTLPNGTEGQVLKIVSGVPAWGAAGGGGGGIASVVAGPGIFVDNTDPANPVVSNTGVLSDQGLNSVLQTNNDAGGEDMQGLGTVVATLFSGNVEGNLAGTASKASTVALETGILYNGASEVTARLAPSASAGVVLVQPTANNPVPAWRAQSALSVGQATLANNVSGPAGQLLYNTALNTTGPLTAGSLGDVLTQGVSAPVFASPSTLDVGSATNLAQNEGILYNSSTGVSESLGPATTGFLLQTNGIGLAPSWVSPDTLSVSQSSNATNVGTTARSDNLSYYLTFAPSNTSGNQALGVDTDISYNPSTNTLTVPQITGNASTATTATNLAGGAANRVPYQTGAGTTAFVNAPTTGMILTTGATDTIPTYRLLTQIPSQMFNITGWSDGAGGNLSTGQDIARSPTNAGNGYFVAPAAAFTISMDINAIPITIGATALGTTSFLQLALAIFNANQTASIGGFPASVNSRCNVVIPYTGATSTTVYASCRVSVRCTGLTTGTGYTVRLIAFGALPTGASIGATSGTGLVGTFAVNAL